MSRRLAADKERAKKLVAEALTVAKEKGSPLTYNGAIILGMLAQEVKDLAGCEVFYRVAMNEAARLQSTQQRLLEILWRTHRRLLREQEIRR